MSSLAAMMASGLGVAPRQFSVTVRPLSRLNSPVCWQATLISGWLSMMLCRPLERSMAGEAPGVPSSSKMTAPLGKSSSSALPCCSPPRTLSAPTWARVSTPVTVRSTVTTGMPASTASLHRRRHAVGGDRADQEAADLLGDGGFDVGGLLGHLVLAVQRADVHAQLLRLILDLRLHEDEEGELEAGDREGDVERAGAASRPGPQWRRRVWGARARPAAGPAAPHRRPGPSPARRSD